MTVAIVMEFDGGTLEQYDQVIQKMGFEPHGPGAPDAQFHWVAKTPDGLLITDVWDSPEAFQAFADTQIGPITAEFGLNPPKLTFHDVHNYLTGG